MPKNTAEIDRELSALLLKRASAQEEVVETTKQIDALKAPHAGPMPVSIVHLGKMPGYVQTSEHRGNMSDARLGVGWDEFHGLRKRAGYSTLSALASAALMSPQALSQCMASPTLRHFRAITPERAARIEALIGWPAKNWPSLA